MKTYSFPFNSQFGGKALYAFVAEIVLNITSSAGGRRVCAFAIAQLKSDRQKILMF